jgi:hypothetical protein
MNRPLLNQRKHLLRSHLNNLLLTNLLLKRIKAGTRTKNLTWVIWTSLSSSKTLPLNPQQPPNHLELDGMKTRNLTCATSEKRSKRLYPNHQVALEDSRKMSLLEKKSLSASIKDTKRIRLFKSKLSRSILEAGTRS